MFYIFFIGGVGGVGKSTTLKIVRSTLPEDKFNIRDFDEWGDPKNAGILWKLDDENKKWRQLATKKWLEVGIKNASDRKHSVIFGFCQPEEIPVVESKNIRVKYCLLSAEPKIIAERLVKRYETGSVPIDFVEENSLYAKVLEKIAKEYGGFIIDTSNLTARETADEIVSWINKELGNEID